MNRAVKNILKILLIGLATTIVRIIGQLSIRPVSRRSWNPAFLHKRHYAAGFTVYGVFAYSLIASLFLIIRNRLSGNRVLQGLKYDFSCCIVWIVYLLEPLPHVAGIDRITYPVADSLALIVMGLLLDGCLEILHDRQIKRSRLSPFFRCWLSQEASLSGG